ncbi:metallophosphoesterase [Nocardioides sp. 1609]|uniref:metallophosphoesterase family protein n=1 Tax=Nocardioides sp. 1609 TaxID=2508327 RepID=UPI00106F6D5C|nr:metallophosphoesterase [Nocardioides sp. 1609]
MGLLDRRHRPLLAAATTVVVAATAVTALAVSGSDDGAAPDRGSTRDRPAVAAPPTSGPPTSQVEPLPVDPDDPMFTFVSSPDMFNADVGDLRTAGIRVENGRNSWNPSYARAVDRVFGTLASYDADAYLVAGDLVEGHWGQDADRTGYFGRTRTERQKLRAVTRAGDFYYGRFKQYFRDVGISPSTLYPAVGDHEIGDNPWRHDSFKSRAVETYKDAWSRSFTTTARGGHRFADRPVGTPYEDTSYATWLTPAGPDGVLLVTVDVFRHGPGGDGVSATVDGRHLAWFRGVLEAAPAEATVIVQAHTPALGPVRSSGSSRLMVKDGEDSPFWRAMDGSGKVDLYLAGEVHAQTARQVHGTVQVSHGGLFAFRGTAYVVGRVYPDRVELESHWFDNTYSVRTRLWATSSKRSPGSISYAPEVLTGTLVLHDDGTVTSSGDLGLNPDLPVQP